jgi:predicted aspartyl protease
MKQWSNTPDAGNKGEIKMGRTVEKITIQNAYDAYNASQGLIQEDAIRRVEVDAIVDTGATYVCLGKKQIEQLGLPFHREVNIRTANGRATRRLYHGALIDLKGRTFMMEVMENDDDTPAWIGYLLLEALDYVVDPKTQEVIPNPAHDGQWTADLYHVERVEVQN